MARGQTFGSERRWLRDPHTGTKVWQLTGYHCHSTKLSYSTQSWTPDGAWIVFFSELRWGRDAPLGLFKVRGDGGVIVQLSDTPVADPFACIDWPRRRVVFVSGDEVRTVGLDDFREEVLVRFPGASAFGGMTMRPDGRAALTTFTEGNVCKLVRIGLEDGVATTIFAEPDRFGRAQYCFDGTGTIRFSGGRFAARPDIAEPQGIWVIEEDGSDLRAPVPRDGWREITHDTWRGTSREVIFIQANRLQITERYPSTIEAVDVDTGALRIVARRGSYWHCCASPDGTRIISDTNWPQRGLVLIDVATGREQILCWPGESGGAPAWGHPHPSFSPDGRRVLYNSDPHGISQLFVALVEE